MHSMRSHTQHPSTTGDTLKITQGIAPERYSGTCPSQCRLFTAGAGDNLRKDMNEPENRNTRRGRGGT